MRTQPPHRELVARAVQVLRVDAGGLLGQQLQHLAQQFVELLGRGRGLDHELAAALQQVGRTRGVVGQAALLAHAVEQRRAHALAQHRGRHQRGRVVVRQRRHRPAQHQVHLAAAGLALAGDVAQVRHRRQRVRAACGHVAEGRFGSTRDGVGVDTPGRPDHDVGAAVLALHVAHEVVAREALDVAPRADHALRHRMGAEAGLVEELERGGQRIVLVLGALVQQHLALAFELVRREAGVAHDVAQHADEGHRVLGQAVHVERGVVLVGVRVDLGAQPLGVEVDAARVARGRALEQHVLDDVADAVQRPALVRAAALDEDRDAGAVDVRHVDAQHAHAIGQRDERGVGVVAGVRHGRDCGRAPRHARRRITPTQARCGSQSPGLCSAASKPSM